MTYDVNNCFNLFWALISTLKLATSSRYEKLNESKYSSTTYLLTQRVQFLAVCLSILTPHESWRNQERRRNMLYRLLLLVRFSVERIV